MQAEMAERTGKRMLKCRCILMKKVYTNECRCCPKFFWLRLRHELKETSTLLKLIVFLESSKGIVLVSQHFLRLHNRLGHMPL